MIQKESQGIITSTGHTGSDTRSSRRIGSNIGHVVTDIRRVSWRLEKLSLATRIKNTREADPAVRDLGLRRTFVRAITTEKVVQAALTDGLAPFVEVAAPIGDGLWYLSVASNGEARRINKSTRQKLVEETAPRQLHELPVSLVRRAISEGYRVRNSMIDEKAQKEVQVLWQDTFGWSYEQVKNLSDRLEAEKACEGMPTVWFSALESPDHTISASSMAERLTIKDTNGEKIDIVELTEWSVDSKNQRNGKMSATVSMLIAQILQDYRKRSDGNTKLVIIAECNTDGAHGVGYKAGLTVPSRTVFGRQVSQILELNVEISGELKNFAFMYLSEDARKNYYNNDVIQELTGNIQS